MATKLARAAGATAMGITAGFVGSSLPVASSATNLAAAESVAARFVSGFEGFSYRDPGARATVADLATPGLAAVLTSPSQAATGPALAAEKFTTTADVTGFEVEGDTPDSVDLLARTDVHVSTVSGSNSSIRLVPVSLVLTAAVWKVSGVAGLTASASVSGSSGSPDAPTTVPAGTQTTRPVPPSAVPGATSPTTPAPATAVGDVPAQYVSWMKAAVAAECPGLPWTVLAGIGKVESDFGRSTLPGVRSGSNPEGAEGPMQFEPATFAAYGTGAPGGVDPPSPYDPADAVYSAAELLCADGGGTPARLYDAIFDYNHSDAYVTLVIAYADEYAQMASDGGASGTEVPGLGSVIVADAEAYLGTPYVWGGENPRAGFDCSGLVQWVYAEAGISLPRVAQDQYDAGPHLAAGATLYPGDLVFFGSGPSGVEHVGIYVGNGEMIDAPYTGAVVRFDRVSTVPLGYVGATRPEIPDMTSGAGVPVFSTGPIDPPHGASLSDVSWHQSGTPGSPSPNHAHHAGGGLPIGKVHVPHHRSMPTTTIAPTLTTAPTSTTGPTSTTVSGSTGASGPGRHHHPTTTTTTPTTTPTTTTSTPTTTTPTTTTSTSTPAPTTSTTTTPVGSTTTSTTAESSDSVPGAGQTGRRHQKAR
jgi:cell wall-associated NlpC family hydrolase